MRIFRFLPMLSQKKSDRQPNSAPIVQFLLYVLLFLCIGVKNFAAAYFARVDKTVPITK